MHKLITFIISLSIVFSLNGQDSFRYTFFDFVPLTTNPALAGSFEGTVRVGTLIREQDYGLRFGQYETPDIYLDAPLIRGFRKQDWIGFGINLQRDQQKSVDADNNVSTLIITNTMGGLTYHFAIDKKQNNVLSLGVQSGNASTYFSNDYFTLGGTILKYFSNGGNGQLSEQVQGTSSKVDKTSNSTGYTIGLTYSKNFNKETNLKTGISVGNIGKNLRNTIMKSGSVSSPPSLKFVVFGIFRTQLSNGLLLEPRVIVPYMDPSWRASAQLMAGIKMKKVKDLIMWGGMGFDPINGISVLLRGERNNLKVGLSFDFNITDRNQISGASEAVEIGANYIFKIYRKPVPDPVLVCPQL